MAEGYVVKTLTLATGSAPLPGVVQPLWVVHWRPWAWRPPWRWP